MLGGREAELVLEEGGFGRISIRVRQVQALHRVQQLLGLLDKVGDIEHDSCMPQGVGRPRCSNGRVVVTVAVAVKGSFARGSKGIRSSGLEHGPHKDEWRLDCTAIFNCNRTRSCDSVQEV